jgi:hypothetical protein
MRKNTSFTIVAAIIGLAVISGPSLAGTEIRADGVW